jgi:hypothetical protein
MFNLKRKQMKKVLVLMSVMLILTLFACKKPNEAVPVLTTAITVTDITQTTATSGGVITDEGSSIVLSRGVCWSTGTKPTIIDSKTSDGAGVGSFTSKMIGLLPNTIYYLKTYATNANGIGYGDAMSFTTLPAITATLRTNEVTLITQTTATLGGNITSDGGDTITARGVCYGITVNPTILNSITSDSTGTGIFTSSLTGLNGNTIYYVRAYATNSVGTQYGNQVSFITSPVLPTITTTTISTITDISAISGGNITASEGTTVTARGICWSTSANPTITDSKTSDSTGAGIFVSLLTGLLPNTIYNVCSYATNNVGTAYGNQVSFTTLLLEIPTLTTTAISSITDISAMSGGNITFNGGSVIIAKGIVWNTTGNPTVLDSKTSDGTETGTFTSSLTGLNGNTSYYVRAYATNSIGTAYGNEISFSTNPVTSSIVNFNLPNDGKLLHSIGDKRIIFTTVGSDFYIKYSNDNGVSYNQGVKVTNIFATDNKARILGNGNIVLFCVNRIYYSDDNMTTIKPCNVLSKDGSTYSYHTPVNSNYPGGYFNFMDGFVENAGVCLLGNYTNSGTGASPVNLYYSLDGITWKVVYTFGQNPNRTDNGTSSGGVGGNPLGDSDNPLITRHIHGVNIGEDGNFYVCTGDVDKEMHFLKCSYNSAADTWNINDMLTGESRNWQRMRAIGVYERNGYLYWGSDGPGIFKYMGVTYECEGIYKCAVSEINNPSQHIIVEPLQDACYSFLNMGYLVFAGLQNDGFVHISFNHGETWTAFAKPSWMTEEVEGVWFNELYKFFVTRTGVIISSTSF